MKETAALFTPGIKGIVHPKIKIMSLSTHPHVVLNLQDLDDQGPET